METSVVKRAEELSWALLLILSYKVIFYFLSSMALNFLGNIFPLQGRSSKMDTSQVKYLLSH